MAQAIEEQISDTEEYITVDLDSKRNMLFEARAFSTPPPPVPGAAGRGRSACAVPAPWRAACGAAPLARCEESTPSSAEASPYASARRS